jgi:hypothetical protein
MAEAVRTLILLALAAAGLTAAAALAAWWFETTRKLRRILRRVLKAVPEAEALDPGQGRAAGLDFAGRSVAVLWDKGSSGLVYGFDELDGAELIIDGHVAARVMRGEPKRPLDGVGRNADQVALRLTFADARFPEFELDLWGDQSAYSAKGQTPADAVRTGRRWLAHVDAVIRKSGVGAMPAPIAERAPEREPEPELRPAKPAAQSGPAREEEDDQPTLPWED